MAWFLRVSFIHRTWRRAHTSFCDGVRAGCVRRWMVRPILGGSVFHTFVANVSRCLRTSFSFSLNCPLLLSGTGRPCWSVLARWSNQELLTPRASSVFKETFRLSLKHFRWPPWRHLPSNGSQTSSYFRIRLSGIQLTWPANLTWCFTNILWIVGMVAVAITVLSGPCLATWFSGFFFLRVPSWWILVRENSVT